MSETDEDLQARRVASLGRLLGLSWAAFERQVVERVREGGFPEFRPPHASLTRSMSLEGTRLTVLAERAGVTKQAMGQLVKEAARRGWVRVKADPSDGRAKIVVYTKKGRELAACIVGAAEGVEAELREAVGERRAGALRNALKLWLDGALPGHESFWSLRRASPGSSRRREP